MAFKLMAVGAALLVLPHLLKIGPMANAAASLSKIGMSGLAFGLLLWGGVRIVERKSTEAVSVIPPAPKARPAATPARSAATTTPSRPTQWSAEVLQRIEWRRFEALIEALFAQAGFETKAQSHGPDDGVDVWLYSKHQPGSAPVSVVQCKHWQGKRVGVDKVRELRGVMAAHEVRRGQFASTAGFTPDAVAFAKDNGINLLDSAAILALIARRDPAQQAALLAVALAGDYWRPTCVNCGSKMVARERRQGGSSFWGCPGFPACRTTLPMRHASAD